MPELPEVYTITSDLRRYVQGAKILDVWINPNYSKIEDKDHFVNTSKGKEISKADRIAKNILLGLDNDSFLLIHLAMTGKLLLRKEGYKADSWEKVKMILEKNKRLFELRFCDMRMFGKIELINASQLNTLSKKYGPEPIAPYMTPKLFHKQIQAKNTNIKNAMLDQKVVAGMGNVYINDALWMAEIHPEKRTQDITLQEAEKLLRSCVEILNEGIKNRGISMSDYVDLLGKKGEQQKYFRVYDKKKCQRCKKDIIFIKLNNRGTYYCPTCQTM